MVYLHNRLRNRFWAIILKEKINNHYSIDLPTNKIHNQVLGINTKRWDKEPKTYWFPNTTDSEPGIGCKYQKTGLETWFLLLQ